MLVALGSVKGAPGVTSTGLALAGVWPRPVVLVEADPAGGDLGYRCRAAGGGTVDAARGLVTLAAAVRDGSAEPGLVVEHAQPLAGGVHLVAGVGSRVQAQGLQGLWGQLAAALAASEMDVLVDLGRLDRSGPVLPVAQAADVVLLVGRASLEQVMHLNASVGALLPTLAGVRVGLVLVGPDQTAQADCADVDELLAWWGRPLAATVPVAHDPRALTRLERGEDPAGRLGRTLLLRRARRLAANVTGTLMVGESAGVVR